MEGGEAGHTYLFGIADCKEANECLRMGVGECVNDNKTATKTWRAMWRTTSDTRSPALVG